jgi:hypothetical protein
VIWVLVAESVEVNYHLLEVLRPLIERLNGESAIGQGDLKLVDLMN